MEGNSDSRSRDKSREESRRKFKNTDRKRSLSREEVMSQRGRHYFERKNNKKHRNEGRHRSRSPRNRTRRDFSISRKSYSSDSDYAPDVRKRRPRDAFEHGRFSDRSPRDSTDSRQLDRSPRGSTNSRDADRSSDYSKDDNKSETSIEEFDKPGDVQLSDDVRAILGEDSSNRDKPNDKVHNVLIKNWTAVLKLGMPELIEEILKKYSPPENFPSLKPPVLNSEIKRTMTEKARKKDNFQVKAQEKIGAAMHAIGLALSNELNRGKSMDTTAVSFLSDAGRILADAHYNISITRRAFITPNVNRLVEDITAD